MELKLFLEFISNSVKEINSDIEKLYSNKTNNKRNVLHHLNSEAMMLDNYIKHFSQSNEQIVQGTANSHQNTTIQQVLPVVTETKTFTIEELAQYNGKNGNPAYVAVNGIVYEVTNNAAWAAATHFGLSAGNDLTTLFASCHSGSDILSRLSVVGNLV